jgi:hypothetical protein
MTQHRSVGAQQTRPSEPMLSGAAAAALLGVTEAVLADWERRFGYPTPVRTDGAGARYPQEMVLALREALDRELSVARALAAARRRRNISLRRASAPASGHGQVIQLPFGSR